MEKRLLFPALRCKLGEWIYYVTYLRFCDVRDWVKPTKEIHTSEKLSEWIQRTLDNKHTQGITQYLLNQSEHFFNAIVIGVYGGHPSWAPLKISVQADIEFEQLSDDQEIEFENSIGLLKLSGNENLFAIDGQHRVAGIKEALKEDPKLDHEEICAIFVGHENTQPGMERTRRLFTTLNKTAKKVAMADIVALDEDDGFAVVTRRLVDEFDVFSQGEIVSFGKVVAIPIPDKKSITSIIGIYQLTQDLYPQKSIGSLPKKSDILKMRPSDGDIEKIYKENCNYWRLLIELIPEYGQVLKQKSFSAGKYREKDRNHLLFRPIGQRAFASSIRVLIDRGQTMREAIKTLGNTNLWLHEKDWHYILWNPIEEKMITANRVVAETFLLHQIGEKGRALKNDRRLLDLLKSRNN